MSSRIASTIFVRRSREPRSTESLNSPCGQAIIVTRPHGGSYSVPERSGSYGVLVRVNAGDARAVARV